MARIWGAGSNIQTAAPASPTVALGTNRWYKSNDGSAQYDPVWPIAVAPVAIESSEIVTDGAFLYVIGCLDTVEMGKRGVFRYSPAANTWTRMTPLPAAAQGAAVWIIGGVIYSFSGYNGSAVTPAFYAYDLAGGTAGAWVNLAVAAAVNVCYRASAAVAGGKAVIVGGFNAGFSPQNQTRIFDPTQPEGSRWSVGTAHPISITEAPTWGYGGLAYLAGGWNGSAQSAVRTYDPATGVWATLASDPLPSGRYRVNNGALVGTKVYLFGGLTTGASATLANNRMDLVASAGSRWSGQLANVPGSVSSLQHHGSVGLGGIVYSTADGVHLFAYVPSEGANRPY